MKFAALYSLITLMAVSAAPAEGEWQAPGPNDVRGPCPGFNTMANHGYLNRDGRNIKRKDVVEIFKKHYNLQEDTSEFLLTQAFKGHLFNADNITLDLNNLGIHGPIEHDVSLARKDWNPLAGKPKNTRDHQDVIPEEAQKLSLFAQHDDTLSVAGLGAFRAYRLDAAKKDKEAIGQTVEFGPNQVLTSFLEASLIAKIFGNPDKNWDMNATSVAHWLTKEELPEGYVIPKYNVTLPESIPFAGKIASYANWPAHVEAMKITAEQKGMTLEKAIELMGPAFKLFAVNAVSPSP